MLKTRDKLKPPTVPHAVTSVQRPVGTDAFAYDANGNMTQRTEFGVVWAQTFNAENRLASITNTTADPDQTWTFVYDGDGNRVKQTNPDGTITLFLGGGVYTVEDAAGNPAVTKYYAIAGQRVAMDGSGGLQYLLTDHLGSIVAILDSVGDLVPDSEQRYMPFGEPRLAADSPTDFGFTGQRSLAAVGLMDYNARFYDAGIGRFVSADSVGEGLEQPQGPNRYSYVYNKPLNYSDPSGNKGVIINGFYYEEEGGTGIVGGCEPGFGCDMGGEVGNTTGGVPPKEDSVDDALEDNQTPEDNGLFSCGNSTKVFNVAGNLNPCNEETSYYETDFINTLSTTGLYFGQSLKFGEIYNYIAAMSVDYGNLVTTIDIYQSYTLPPGNLSDWVIGPTEINIEFELQGRVRVIPLPNDYRGVNSITHIEIDRNLGLPTNFNIVIKFLNKRFEYPLQ